jgi:hypothetical protein
MACRRRLHTALTWLVLKVTANMNEGINEIRRLLLEIAEHLKAGTTADTRKAVAKLERIAALASTLALTVKAARR